MGKEHSNTLRKRGMNVLGKVVGQQQTLCTGNTLYKLCLIGKEKIEKERDTVCSHRDANDLLKIVHSNHLKYAIDKEL